MSNIRLYFSKSLSNNLTDTLDKSQSHYVNKVMRVKQNEVFSLFNSSGEWEAKILNISKGIVQFNVTKQLRQKENFKELWLAFSPIKSNYFNFIIQFIMEDTKKKRTNNNTQDRNISLDTGPTICFKFFFIHGGLVSISRFA